MNVEPHERDEGDSTKDVANRGDRCPVCGDGVESGVRECATCGTPLRATSASTFAVVITLVLVCIGTTVVAPGLGVLLAIGSVAPIIRLTMVTRRRERAGLPTSRLMQFGLYLSSLWVTAVMLWSTGLAAFLTFCFSCLGVAAATRGSGWAIFVATVLAIAVSGLLLWSYSKWIHARWKRDISRDDE